jgi:hypothetical protein
MEEELKMKGIKTEEEVWKRRERKKKREIVSDRITMEEWRKYFSELLGGDENRQEKEKGTGKGRYTERIVDIWN